MITCGTQVVSGSNGGGATAPSGTGVATVSSGAFVTPVASAASVRTTLDAQQDVFTTRGDLVRAGVAGVAERVALGTSGQVLTSDGTDAAWAAPTVTAAQVSDATTAGRAVLTAADAPAQLTALGVSAFAQTILDDTTAAAARTTLGLGDAAGASIGSDPGNVASGPSATWPGLYGATAFYCGGESSTGWIAADYAAASAAAAVPAFGPGQSIVITLMPRATPTGIEMICSHGASGARGWTIDVGRQAGSRRQVSVYLYGLNGSVAVALTGSEFTVDAAYVIAIAVLADKSVRFSVNGAAVASVAALSGTYIAPTSADTYYVGSPREFSPTFYPLISALVGEVRTYSTELSDADLVAACAGVATGTIPTVATGTVSTRFLPSGFCGGLRVTAQTGVTWLLKGGASLRPV